MPVPVRPEAGVSALLRGRLMTEGLVTAVAACTVGPSGHRSRHGSPTLYICQQYLEWEFQVAHYRGAAAGHSSGDWCGGIDSPEHN